MTHKNILPEVAYRVFVEYGQPVRSPSDYKNEKHKICISCGKGGTKSNPITNGHKTPYGKGIFEFSLSPEFLNSEQNVVRIHRRKGCDVALTTEQIVECLKKTDWYNPPPWVPKEIRDLFGSKYS